MKFLMIFIDKKFNYNLNPDFLLTMNELMNEGGQKTILNLKTMIGDTIKESMNE